MPDEILLPSIPARIPQMTVDPPEAAVAAAHVVRFTVTGAGPGPVTWSVMPEPPGIFNSGVFIAHPTIDAPSVHTVTATASDGSSAVALLRIVAVSVTITPGELDLRAEEQQQFLAFAAGDPSNGIAWSISPTVGSISNGLYTPPPGHAPDRTIFVRATSTLDPNRSATAAVRLLMPKPMTSFRRFAFGAGLFLFAFLLIGLAIAFWPLLATDLVTAKQESAAAALLLTGKQAQTAKAKQEFQSATQAAAARIPHDSSLEAVAANKKDAVTVAEAAESSAAKDATDKSAALKIAQDALVTVLLFGTMSREINYLLLVLIMGGLGSFVHTAKSFTGYAGNRSLVASWSWWYVLQPLIGMVLALIVYVVIRGGFFTTGAGPSAVNAYGIAAVSGLVGMFSKQASDKLSELFCTLFKTTEDAQRKDKMTLQPSETAAAAPSPVTKPAASGQ
jgi:hypothetical protein